MSFISGKLKPRIRPKIGARVAGAVDSSDNSKAKGEEQSTSSGIQSADLPTTSKEHNGSVISEDEVKSNTTSATPISKEPQNMGKICDNSPSANLQEKLDLGENKILDKNISPNSDNTEKLSFAPGGTPVEHCDSQGIITSTEQTELVCDVETDKLSSFTTAPIGEANPANETASTVSKIPRSSRLNSLKLHKPNLKKFSRPNTCSTPQVDKPVQSCRASPKADGVSSHAIPVTTGNSTEALKDGSDCSPNVGCSTSAPVPGTSGGHDSSPKAEFPIGKSSGLGTAKMDRKHETDTILDQQKTELPNTTGQSKFKIPSKIGKRAPILSSASLKSDTVKPKVGIPKIMVSGSGDESNPQDTTDVLMPSDENVYIEEETGESIPVIDTTITTSVSPLTDIDVNAKAAVSLEFEKEPSDASAPKAGDISKTASPSKMNKLSKLETDDVKLHYAMSAVDYLKRHDHALGDSILRRLIIGDKSMETRSPNASMCSTCNPQTLKKCLSSLWAFDKSELKHVIRKAAERQKVPSVSYASLPGKTLFKPSLGRQRAPTLTASTYGKMSFEVKERLAKQYGSNPPQLNKLRMLDLIFYNPSDNPMSCTSKNVDTKKKPDKRSESGSSKGSDSESDPDDPSEDVQKDKDVNGESQKTTDEPCVPQVRIGDEGQIILAPESLVMKKKEPEVMNSPVIEEFSFSDSNKKKLSQDRRAWTYDETLQFYKSLHSLGTDFSMMNELFPDRSRANLKSKFKREEKRNPALIDKVLTSQGQSLNITDIEKDLTADKALRRLCQKCIPLPRKPSMGQKVSAKKSWVQAELLSTHRTDTQTDTAKPSGAAERTTTPDDDQDANASSPASSDVGEDAIFKRPSNILPPRKRRPVVKHIPNPPQKRQRVESRDEKSSKEIEDAVFKKPRIPKKRRVPVKKPVSPTPPAHLLPLSIPYEEEDSDTDDSASNDGADDERVTLKTDVKGHNYRYSRSVTVNLSDPEVPIDVNETIEHDRPETPLSDTMSEADTEPDSDSEAGEEVEVVLNIKDIESHLLKQGIDSIQDATQLN